ncbi:MAG: redox-regulated ATPase YchF [Deltaproteobacteria bacterium]|nr:redox-regulated ATPase YchF [Deltaproteobacteria bacterium]
MQVGICGYPGSGKSTVFEALAPGATSGKGGISYGNIKVPDPRIDRLAEIFSPKKKVYAEVTFLDVGGQSRADTGAFSTEVVQHMRNADVLVHVARGFENPMLAQSPNPRRDRDLFADEINLLDLQIIERRGERWKKENKKGAEVVVNDKLQAALEDGIPLRALDLSNEELATLSGIQLLSLKPLITVFNLSEDGWADDALADLRETKILGGNELSMALCGAVEKEIAELDAEDQAEFLEGLGLGEPARHEFVRAAYRLLDLISFLTAGPDECRAWPIHRGTIARKAAGKVHSDIERGFIRAEVYRLEDLEEHGTEAALKSAGKMHLEGKEYVVKDGDVVNYRFNV